VDLQKRGLSVIESLSDEMKKELDAELLFSDNTTLAQVTEQLQKGMTFVDFAEYMKSRRGHVNNKVRKGNSFANFLLPYNMHDEFIRGRNQVLETNFTYPAYVVLVLFCYRSLSSIQKERYEQTVSLKP